MQLKTCRNLQNAYFKTKTKGSKRQIKLLKVHFASFYSKHLSISLAYVSRLDACWGVVNITAAALGAGALSLPRAMQLGHAGLENSELSRRFCTKCCKEFQHRVSNGCCMVLPYWHPRHPLAWICFLQQNKPHVDSFCFVKTHRHGTQVFDFILLHANV